ncbi:hypothetical protein [Comamonas kerstersii]|nr:hypothetical protein [Comamonas kerstersii]
MQALLVVRQCHGHIGTRQRQFSLFTRGLPEFAMANAPQRRQ